MCRTVVCTVLKVWMICFKKFWENENQILYTRRFQKSLKKCQKRGFDLERLRKVLSQLEMGNLSSEYHPHNLSGRLANVWECHVSPDWLLLWEQNEEDLILLMIDTGTHSDVF